MTTHTTPDRRPSWRWVRLALAHPTGPDTPAQEPDATIARALDAAAAAQQAQRLNDALGGAVWVSYL